MNTKKDSPTSTGPYHLLGDVTDEAIVGAHAIVVKASINTVVDVDGDRRVAVSAPPNRKIEPPEPSNSSDRQ